MHHGWQVSFEQSAEQTGGQVSSCQGGLELRKMVLTEDLNLGIVNRKEGFKWHFMRLVRQRNLIEKR